jgi:LOR/SDH bifunctional enzyme conserved region
LKTPVPGTLPEHEIVRLDGHMLDSMVLPKVLDVMVDTRAAYTVLELDVGATRTDQRHVRVHVSMWPVLARTASSSTLISRQAGDRMRSTFLTVGYGELTPERRRKRQSLLPILWAVLGALLLVGNLGLPRADGASVTTTAPTASSTSQPATTIATTVPTTVATTVPTTSVTTTTEPSTTTTTASSTSTTRRRVVVGIAATRGLVVTEEPGNTQSGWIAFGILLVVVLGLAVGWFVHERRWGQ